VDVRLCALPGDAVVKAAGVIWVDSAQSQEEATRAVRALHPDLDRHAIARAVAIAYGSPTATGTRRPAGRAARHRAPAGAAPSGPGPARRPVGSDRRPAWGRRARLLALAAAVLAVGPPVHPLVSGGTAEAAVPPGLAGGPATRPASPPQPAPRATSAGRRPPPAAPVPRPAAQSAAAPPVGPTGTARRAAPAPAARPGLAGSRPAPPAPPPPPAPTAAPTSAPAGPPDPIPTVVATVCTLLPVPLPVCPTP
jgi:hypothetical protein